jgi:DNA methyltransferase 1-associated protein 1
MVRRGGQIRLLSFRDRAAHSNGGWGGFADADALHCIYRTDGMTPMGTSTKATHQAVYLRSFRLSYPKAAVAAKVTQIANELGISLSRLVMPTRDTLAHHDALLDAITTLVEMKKVGDRMEQDMRTAKIRLGLRSSVPPGEVDTSMEVDEDGQPAPDTLAEGRAQSVVSTRSGRSRKQVGFRLPQPVA